MIGLLFFVFHGQDIVSTSTVTQTIDNKGTSTSCLKTCSTNYWIYTNHETLQDSDNLFVGKWDSPNIYNELQVGHTYNMTVIGLGIPTLGWYRNIIQFKEA
jgi:hypothetical protein